MRRGERVGLGAWFGGGWVSILALGALSCVFGTSPPARCQDTLVTEDFEGYEEGSFPSGWNDLADVVAPQEEERSVVRTATGADGEETRVLEIRSLFGVSQGIFRRIQNHQETYRVTVDVYLVQDMPRSFDNIPVEIAFAIQAPTEPYTTWPAAGADGSPALWSVFSIWSPLQQQRVGPGMQLHRWYRVSLEVTPSIGLIAGRVLDVQSFAEVVSGTATFSGMIGRRFDTVYIGNQQRGTAGQEATMLVDNISYTDPSGGVFPDAAFTVVDPPAGCFLAGEPVRLDASASTTPEGSEIVSYEWDFGDGTTAEGPTASHAYDRCRRFEVALKVTNDRTGSSTVKRSVCVAAPPPDPGILAPWTATEIGTPALPGAAWPVGEAEPGCVAVCVGGAGVSGKSDQCQLICQEVDGDGSISVRVESLSGGGSGAAVGTIIRGGLDVDSAYAALHIEKLSETSLRYVLSYRPETGANRKTADYELGASVPTWLRLRRESGEGHVFFTAESSPDAVSWTQVGTAIDIPALGPTVLAGAVAYGRDNAASTSFQGLQATICGLEWTPSAPEGTAFRRGDANCDGTEDLSDAVRTFGFLFLGEETPCCLRAADTNRDGEVNISDGIYLLGFLFTGGAAPPAPFGACGHDPDSTLPCAEYPICP